MGVEKTLNSTLFWFTLTGVHSTSQNMMISCKFFDTVSRFRKVDRWYIICPKHVCRFDLVFFVRAKRKYINFSQITVATTAVDSENGVFQTSLDFDKIKALLNLSVHFSKITYHKVYLGKVWKNRPPDDASANFDIYWHWLLKAFSSGAFHLLRPQVGRPDQCHGEEVRLLVTLSGRAFKNSP